MMTSSTNVWLNDGLAVCDLDPVNPGIWLVAAPAECDPATITFEDPIPDGGRPLTLDEATHLRKVLRGPAAADRWVVSALLAVPSNEHTTWYCCPNRSACYTRLDEAKMYAERLLKNCRFAPTKWAARITRLCDNGYGLEECVPESFCRVDDSGKLTPWRDYL